jgi:hypothetical protein
MGFLTSNLDNHGRTIMKRAIHLLAAAAVLGLFHAQITSAEVGTKKPAASEAIPKTTPEPAKMKSSVPAQKIAPFKPIPHKKIASFARTGRSSKAVLLKKGALTPAVAKKTFKGTIIGGRFTPRPPAPPTPKCNCSVTMGLNLTREDNVFFTDEALTASYSINCATSATIGELEYWDYRAALAAAEGGYAIDYGSSGLFIRNTDPAWESKQTGSVNFAGRAPGVYRWYISATNAENGTRSEQALVIQLIDRPSTTAACGEYNDCIAAMARYMKPRINAGITTNAALDAEVEAFRDGVYDRRVIWLRLEQDLLSLANITCTTCGPGSRYDGGLITLDFCLPTYPTDYAFLHELVHRAGFDERLIAAYTARGLAEPTMGQVEMMAAQVAGAPFDRSRICTEY